jgi:hypothetical protein
MTIREHMQALKETASPSAELATGAGSRRALDANTGATLAVDVARFWKLPKTRLDTEEISQVGSVIHGEFGSPLDLPWTCLVASRRGSSQLQCFVIELPMEREGLEPSTPAL